MRLTTTIRRSLILTALMGFTSAAHSQSPMTIDFPGGGLQGAYGINNRGQIVGSYLSGNGGSYLYEAGEFSPISISPPAQAFGISDSGEIVGSYVLKAGGFIDNGGAVTRIADPSANVTAARGISSYGAYIVGTTGAGGLSLSSDGFLYTGGVFTTIDVPGFVGYTGPSGVNNNGQVVGSVLVTGASTFLFHGFLDNGGVFTLLDVPGAVYTQANGINDYGTIVGTYANAITANTQTHGFVYNGGIFTSFDFPGATSTSALGINNDGGIVGSYTDAAGNFHGFFYPAGAQGYVNPKYLTMGVTYAPPGGSASSVSYQTTNVVGNTSTNTDSFENSVSVTASTSAGGSLFGFISGKVTTTQSSGWTQKTTTSNEVTISKTSSITFKTPGVPTVYSPVDHDYDIIWLWLNPVAVFTLPNTNISGPILWTGYGFDLNDPLQDIDVWPIYVGYLNGDFFPLDAQDAGALSRSWVTTQTFAPGEGPAITSADFPNILKADPFAYNPYDANSGYVLTLAPGTNPATSTDGRFTASTPGNATPQSIPYPQAPPNSTQGIQATYSSAYSTSAKVTQTADYKYTVGFGLDESGGATFLSGDLKTEWNMTWDNTSQTSNTNTTTQTDTAVITGPPCPATTAPCNPEYTEPHEFAVYQDNLYGTFMFWPNPYFSIATVAPATRTVAQGSTVSYTISTLANAGYSGTSISFNVTGLPAGASFNQGAVEPGGPFALAVSTTSATPTGSYPLTISATDGSQSYFTYATLVVNTPTPVATTTALSISPSGGTLSTGAPYTLTATVSPASGSVVPGGNVVFSIGSATQTAALNSSGVATYRGTAPGTSGTLTLSAAYQGSAAFSPSTSNKLTETIVTPNFTLNATSVTVNPGASSANTSTITLTPSGGFTGSVALTAAVTSSPAGAQDPPTLSFGSTTPVNISSTSPGMAVLTISTTAPTSAALFDSDRMRERFCMAGTAILFFLILLTIPIVRPFRRKLGVVLALLVAIALGVIACGNHITSNPGTTAGNYTITVTGKSGSVTSTGTLTLTVQ